jgi:segregation and condensation protein A
VIQIAFPGFSGTPEALREALRRGRVSPREVPVLKVIEDALAQLPPSLKERSEVLPILAELLVLKLAPERAMEAEEGKEAPLVQALLDLAETVAFLEARLKARARLLPVAPPPLPRPALRLSPKTLWQAARPFRRAVLALPRETFGLKEAWERLRGLIRGRVRFQALPLATWGERAVAFAALLEAHRLGLLRLHQEAPFAPLHVEVLQERQELSA